jgi:zinc transport system permease protein
MDDFLIKALLAGFGIAISTSLIGVFILWKKISYFGDALAHSSLLGLAFSSIIAWQPIFGVIIFALIFAVLVSLVDRENLYSKDTIIGIISYSCLAFGLILIAIFPSNVNLSNYLFGDIIAISKTEIILIYLGSFLVIIATIFWFKKLLLSTINHDLAVIEGINVARLELKFLLLTSLIIAISIKITGIFLITALLILPAAIARNFSKTPIQMIFITLGISILANFCGLLISLNWDLPAGASIIGVLASLFFIILIGKKQNIII